MFLFFFSTEVKSDKFESESVKNDHVKYRLVAESKEKMLINK